MTPPTTQELGAALDAATICYQDELANRDGSPVLKCAEMESHIALLTQNRDAMVAGPNSLAVLVLAEDEMDMWEDEDADFQSLPVIRLAIAIANPAAAKDTT